MSEPPLVVVGGGIGGLSAAIRLARAGQRVVLIEARSEIGGLASDVSVDGIRFDGGPYILLDRVGLEWAYRGLGLELVSAVGLERIECVYQVDAPGQPSVTFHGDLERTAEGFERHWPGSAQRYRRFVAQVRGIHQALLPLLFQQRPGILSLLRCGAWRHARFLHRSLQQVLQASGLPVAVCQALAIWTHIAGQAVESAPSPMAFVPALIHEPGAFYPRRGIGSLLQPLVEAALSAGVEVRCAQRVRALRTTAGRVSGLELASGEILEARAVISNAHGIGTYAELVPAMPAAALRRLTQLPLQSPGICVYLAIQTPAASQPQEPYLRFRLPGGSELCRLLITPGRLAGATHSQSWSPARLIMPMRHADAQQLGPDGQLALAQRLIAEPWWHSAAGSHRVLAIRTPAQWGQEYHLYRDSMNPVMTAQFMRQGRLAHRSPFCTGLYLCGSATHPGQWLSFCAISGILAANQLLQDLA